MQGYTNASASASLRLTDVSVTFSTQGTPDYADYPCRASITLAGCTSDKQATVTYNPDDAVSGNYAPWCETYDGGIYLYSKVTGTTTISTVVVEGVTNFFNLDATPTEDSNNLISSGGVYTALEDYVTKGTGQTITGRKTWYASNYSQGPVIKSGRTTINQNIGGLSYLDGSDKETCQNWVSINRAYQTLLRNENSQESIFVQSINSSGVGSLTLTDVNGTVDILTSGNGMTLTTDQEVTSVKAHRTTFKMLNKTTYSSGTQYAPVAEFWATPDRSAGHITALRDGSNGSIYFQINHPTTGAYKGALQLKTDGTNAWSTTSYRSSPSETGEILTKDNGVTLSTEQSITASKTMRNNTAYTSGDQYSAGISFAPDSSANTIGRISGVRNGTTSGAVYLEVRNPNNNTWIGSLRVNTDGTNAWVTAPTRTYNASNTNDVVTIGMMTGRGYTTNTGTVTTTGTMTSGNVVISNGGTVIKNGYGVDSTTTIGSLMNVTSWSNNTNLLTRNAIAYWDGRYQTNSNASNLTYCKKGAFGSACTYDSVNVTALTVTNASNCYGFRIGDLMLIWGYVRINDSTSVAVTFPSGWRFASADRYRIVQSQYERNDSGDQFKNGWTFSDKSTSGFTVRNNTNGTNTCEWLAIGS